MGELIGKYGDNITINDLADIHPSKYVLVDVRDEISHDYGCIPDSISDNAILEKALNNTLDRNISYVLYCMHGKESADIAYEMALLGYDAVNLKGGYGSFLKASLGVVDENRQYEAEHSINKNYRKQLLSPFLRAIDRYELIKPNDRIAVCISGGKDSMLMAKLFQELHRHTDIPFELVFLVMDPGYSELNRLVIEENARILGIPITVFETDIFDSVYKVEKSPCALCAKMRRGYLYSNAKRLGCNKIALGHHYDDVIETTLMAMMYSGQIQTMMPKLKSDNFEGMELIRPMYLIREKDIMKWRDHNSLHFIQCACRFTDTCSSCREDGSSASKRIETKKLIAELKKTNPFIEKNIFKAMENVQLDAVIEYKKDGVRHNFLDGFKNSDN